LILIKFNGYALSLKSTGDIMSRVKVNGKWLTTKYYLSLHRITKDERGFTKLVNDAIYVQYFKTKKAAIEAETKIDKNLFITFVDFHAVIDIQKFGVPAMFSLNSERLPVYEVEDITAVK
jgi:glutathionyl-hydroquinone reductase